MRSLGARRAWGQGGYRMLFYVKRLHGAWKSCFVDGIPLGAHCSRRGGRYGLEMSQGHHIRLSWLLDGGYIVCVFFYNRNTWMSMIYDVIICEGWTNFMQSQVISTPSRGRIPLTFHPFHQGQTSDAVWCLSWKRETTGLLNGFIANKSMGKKCIRWDELVPWAWLVTSWGS